MENYEINMMNSRTAILSEIKKNLKNINPQGIKRDSLLLKSEIPDTENMIDRFSRELRRVDGDFSRVENHEEAARFISANINSAEYRSIFIGREAVLTENGYLRRLKDLKPFISVAEYNENIRFDAIPSKSVSVVASAYLIAETGTAVVVSSKSQPRILAILSEQLFIIAEKDQLVADLETILGRIKDDRLHTAASALTLITGPSRTADIEKILVKGVHGPKNVMVILVG